MTATALIAEDEPLLAANLKALLAKLWPELQIVATPKFHSAFSCSKELKATPNRLKNERRDPDLDLPLAKSQQGQTP